MNAAQRFIGVILAAGEGRRFGGPKQIEITPTGQTLLGLTIETLQHAGIRDVVVVSGARPAEIERVARFAGVSVAHNPQWSTGMGSSIRCAARYVAEEIAGEIAGVLICCADQPYLSSRHLLTMQKKFAQGAHLVVASSYNNTFGVPALFDTQLLCELERIDAAKGAKSLITMHESETCFVNDERLCVDIDTREDWMRWTEFDDEHLHSDRRSGSCS